MRAHYSHWLKRWQAAGLLDSTHAERISAFESESESDSGLPWPIWVALVFGGLMLAAGALLFVAAHWDDLSPAARFSLVLLMVAILHLGGSFTRTNSPSLSITLHAVGTAALGGGIFLTGQIFHLQSNWPEGFLLWALGAVIAWRLLGDWVQTSIAALLIPAWLSAFWIEQAFTTRSSTAVLLEGLLLLALAYASASDPDSESPFRTSLSWIGLLAVGPLALALTFNAQSTAPDPGIGWLLLTIGRIVAIAAPLLTGFFLRGHNAWPLVPWALWILLFSLVIAEHTLAAYAWCGLGAIGMVAWGAWEGAVPRVNLGTILFAVTITAFYFSSVMDSLGRSFGLIGLGVLFLLGGWFLEKTRRRLVRFVRRRA